MENIKIVGLNQNNLKNISLVIPKRKIVVFTGVSGSGKSSIVFDTIAAEAKRSLNETFPSFVRSKLPKYLKPKCDLIANLSPAIIVDQDGIGANMRSTVGTFTEISAGLRVLFSRLGEPYVGPASAFSFNDQRGMCKVCSGLGKVTDINIDKIIDKNKAISNGAFIENTLKMGSWYWSQLMKSTIFDIHKPIKDYTEEEYRLLLFGTDDGETNLKNGGIYNLYKRKFLTRETIYDEERANQIVMQKPCPACLGKKLNRMALACWINGFNIDDLCNLELVDLKKELLKITDVKVSELVKSIINMLDRMLEMGLGYLNLARLTNTLSNGEAQRLKLVKYLGSSLSDMLYIFDEPSTGMHPRDVYRMNNLLINLKEKGNSVIVVEHDQDVIRIADEVVDVGPLAGSRGGEIVFQGPYDDLLSSSTITGESLRNKLSIKKDVRISKQFLSIHNANLHNLKNISVNIPLNVITVITGVAGSGKSSLMKVFADRYHDQVIKIDQKPITATGRSTPASYLGFMDEIRKEFAKVSKVEEGLFSFNSMGACPECKGKGQIVIELAYMDPIITTCESCEGSRYSKEALSYLYKGKNILDVISLSVEEALNFFDNPKIIESLKALIEVGLSYLTLGQPTSTLSGGERQRLKLAYYLRNKGSIYLLDEPTTGLHPSDVEKLMVLFNKIVDSGNTVIIIEHNLEVIKQADYLIDIGPDGGKHGGEVVFTGTPEEMITTSSTITAKCLSASCSNKPLSNEELQSLIAINNDNEDNKEMSNIKLYPIGRIETAEGNSRLVLCPKYQAALKGLEGFSHIQVIWWFDGCDDEISRSQLINQKPYTKGPDVLGTFATRSPARPNPIAISTCEVASIDYEIGVINLYYIDALHGTPLLDIKPYTPSLDKVGSPKVPNWCQHWPKELEDNQDFDWEKEFNFNQNNN